MNLIIDEEKSEELDEENDKDKKISLMQRIRNNIEKNANKVQQDNTSEASFSFSHASDIDSLCENMEKKSNQSIHYPFESTLQNAEEDLNKEIDLYFDNMAKTEQGIDKNIKLQSSNLYKELVTSIAGSKNQNNQNLDKTNMGYTKYASISGVMDDQTIKLKNDLSGDGVENNNVYILKDQLSKQSSLKNDKNKIEYKKTMSLEFSKERESEKKELISSSSQNKQSLNKVGTKNSKNG